MARPYKNFNIAQLEELAVTADDTTLRVILNEASNRATNRALSLLSKLKAHLGDTMPQIRQEQIAFAESPALPQMATASMRPCLPKATQLPVEQGDLVVMADRLAHVASVLIQAEAPLRVSSAKLEPVTAGTASEPSTSRDKAHLLNGVWWIAGPPAPSGPLDEPDLVQHLLRGASTSVSETAAASTATTAITAVSSHRIRHLFEFIKAWHMLAEPPPRRLDQYETVMPVRDLLPHVGPYVRVGTDDEARGQGLILEVRRPPQDPPPAVPVALRGWVEGAIDQPGKPPGLREQLVAAGGGREVLRDGAARSRACDLWSAAWLAWATEEMTRRPVRDWYTRLFGLRGKLEGRSHEVELVLGAGVLNWPLPGDQAVRHPLVLKRVTVSYDDREAVATVRDSDAPVEFSGNCLAHTDLAGPPLGVATARMAELRPHPIDQQAVSAAGSELLNRWFGGMDFAASGTSKPAMHWSPHLFIRTSGGKVIAFVDQILRKLESPDVEVPPFFSWITGDTQPPSETRDAAANTNDERGAATSTSGRQQADRLEDFYFCKAHNGEQRQIASLIERHPGVQVQGPPGTGKTHTIANILGHALAKGWRVLVTSQTAKALGEVRQQLPAELRPLCIPLLDSDADGRELLQASLAAIANRSGTYRHDLLQSEISRLSAQRLRQHSRHRELEAQLLTCMIDEHQAITVGPRSVTPQEAAKRLSTAGADWMSGPISLGADVPLTPEEIAELYATNATVSAAQEDILTGITVPLDHIPTPDRLCAIVETVREALDASAGHQPAWWSETASIEVMQQAYEAIQAAVAPIADLPEWAQSCMADALRSPQAARLWRDIQQDASQLALAADAVTALHIASTVKLSDPQPATDLPLVEAAITQLEQGGALRSFGVFWFNKAFGKRLDCWLVNGKAPTTVAELEAVRTILRHASLHERMRRSWSLVVQKRGGPALVSDPECILAQHATELTRIRAALAWADHGQQAVNAALAAVGYRSGSADDTVPTGQGVWPEQERLPRLYRGVILPALAARMATVRSVALRTTHEAAFASIAGLAKQPDGAGLRHLSTAWLGADVGAYHQAYQAYAAAVQAVVHRDRRTALLKRLRTVAPGWAASIAARRAPHDSKTPPDAVADAWDRRQYADELDRRHAQDPNQIQAQLSDLENELSRTTNELVAAMAWDRQLDRLSGSAGTALRTWSSLTKQIGAGTGKLVPGLQAAARVQMVEAQSAVPVWIMPIGRIYEAIDPARSEPFDLLIVDESSQADLRGVPIWWTAKRVIVVGDVEQVTPSAAFKNVTEVANLQQQHLAGYRAPEIWDGKQSLYTIAGIYFGSCRVTLTEHFRCHPDIIAFSDHLCYAGKETPLKTMRAADSAPFAQPLVEVRVPAVITASPINLAEADRVMAVVGAIIENPAYAKKTIGIISLVGSEQADHIDRQIRVRLNLDADAVERLKGGGGSTRRLCGNPPDFQGDERDIIILTMVDLPTVPPGPLRLKRDTAFVQRYNVAVSRARHQVWLVHSLDPSVDLQPSDLRRLLIEHVRDPSVIRRRLEAAVSTTQSPFEADVLAGLIHAGFQVRTQHPVGAYRIDLLVHDGERQLAVECDGERWHGPDRTIADLERQRILERLGYTFHRIRGARYYRDKVGTSATLRAHIERQGIRPHQESVPTVATTDGSGDTPEVAAVRRRSDALLATWAVDTHRT